MNQPQPTVDELYQANFGDNTLHLWQRVSSLATVHGLCQRSVKCVRREGYDGPCWPPAKVGK